MIAFIWSRTDSNEGTCEILKKEVRDELNYATVQVMPLLSTQ